MFFIWRSIVQYCFFFLEVIMQYLRKLQQLVTYSRCRIYRKLIRSLSKDSLIRLSGDPYLFYFTAVVPHIIQNSLLLF